MPIMVLRKSGRAVYASREKTLRWRCPDAFAMAEGEGIPNGRSIRQAVEGSIT